MKSSTLIPLFAALVLVSTLAALATFAPARTTASEATRTEMETPMKAAILFTSDNQNTPAPIPPIDTLQPVAVATASFGLG